MATTTTEEQCTTEAGETFDVPLEDLEPHPLHLEIYGAFSSRKAAKESGRVLRKAYGHVVDEDLTSNVRDHGLQTPIKVDRESRVLAGVRRWLAAKDLGWDTIPAQLVDLEDEDAARQYILVANAYRRDWPGIVRYREAEAYYDLYRNALIDKDGLEELAQRSPETEEPKTLAAAAAGIGKSTFHNFRFMLEESGAEARIFQAVEDGRISQEQAEALEKRLSEARTGIKVHDHSPNSCAQSFRGALEEAVQEHTLSEQARLREKASLHLGNAARIADKLTEELSALNDLDVDLGRGDIEPHLPQLNDLEVALDSLAARVSDPDVVRTGSTFEVPDRDPSDLAREDLVRHFRLIRRSGFSGIVLQPDLSVYALSTDGSLFLRAPSLAEEPVIPSFVPLLDLGLAERGLNQDDAERAGVGIDRLRREGRTRNYLTLQDSEFGEAVFFVSRVPPARATNWIHPTIGEEILSSLPRAGVPVDPDLAAYLLKWLKRVEEPLPLLTISPEDPEVRGARVIWTAPVELQKVVPSAWGEPEDPDAPSGLTFPATHLKRLLKTWNPSDMILDPKREVLVGRSEDFVWALRGRRPADPPYAKWPLAS